MMNYMASCGGNNCSNFDASTAQWFKISQDGKSTNGSWVQADTVCKYIAA
jgi:hypothetical protein